MFLPTSRVITRRRIRLWLAVQDLFAGGGGIRVELEDRFREALRL